MCRESAIYWLVDWSFAHDTDSNEIYNEVSTFFIFCPRITIITEH